MPQLTLPHTISPGIEIKADEHQENYEAIRDILNALDSANLLSSLADLLGVSQSGVVRRGKTSITGEETRASSTYDFLTTHDEVTNVVLPASGLLLIHYRATVKTSVANAGRAALYLNGNPVVVMNGNTGAQDPAEATGPFAANTYGLLHTDHDNGMEVTGGGSGAAYTGPTTTGELIPGSAFVAVEAAAGTYTVGVKFKATSGTISAKNRLLRVAAIGF